MPHLLLLCSATPAMRERLERRFTVHDGRSGNDLSGRPGTGDLEAVLAAHAHEIEAVLTDGHLGVAPAVTDRLERLAIVSCYGVGYDNIDASALAKRGVVVTHTPDVLNDEVADTAVALLLAATRRIVHHDRYVRDGRWRAEGAPPLTRGLSGKTVGMVGFGRIGQTIARRLETFGCRIVYHARSPRDVAFTHFPDLVTMANESDVLVVITPGGAATHHLVGREALDALGPEGTLVNVARGTVVDEAALVAALAEGRLGAAALDVFEREPHVPRRLLGMENVVLAPHVGSATVETRRAMGDLAVDNLLDFAAKGTVRTRVPESHGIARTGDA